MAELTKTHGQGVLLHDERIVAGAQTDKGAAATESAYTQAGPRPGAAVPQEDTALALETSGSQSEDGHIEVRTLRGGHAGRGGGGIGFRDVDAGDAANQIKGWDGVQAITGWQRVDYKNAGIATTPPPHVIRLQSGKLLACGQVNGSNQQQLYTYDPATSAWSAATLSGIAASASEHVSCLVELPSGRVLLIIAAWVRSQVDVWRSDDEGVTWEIHSAAALDAALTDQLAGPPIVEVAPVWIRAAYSAEQILLLLHFADSGANGQIAQYASDDEGGRFVLVSDDFITDSSLTYEPWTPDVVGLPEGGFVVLAVENNIAAGAYWYTVRRLASAWDVLAATTPDLLQYNGSPYPVSSSGFGLALWMDEAGILYAMTTTVPSMITRSYILLHTSLDNGSTWSISRWRVWSADSLTTRPDEFSAASTGGRAIAVTRFADATTAYALLSLAAMELGGFSSHTLPMADTAGIGETDYALYDDDAMMAWGDRWYGGVRQGLCYLPVSIPENQGWTLSAGAAGTGTLAATAEHQIDTAIGQTRWYQDTYASGGTLDKMFVEFAVRVEDGEGDASTSKIAARIQLSDGDAGATYGYQVEIRLDSAGFTLRDMFAGADIGSVSVDMTTRMHFRVALEKASGPLGYVRLWYARDVHVRDWTAGPSDTGLTSDGGASGLGHYLYWGHFVSSTPSPTSTSWWAMAGHAYQMDTWGPRSSGAYALSWINPTHIWPITVPTRPLLLKDGLKVRAASGPTKLGDVWDIEADYDYPLRAIYPHTYPSPARVWRSTGTAAIVNVVWNLDKLFAASSIESSQFGVALLNINFQTAYIEGYNPAGAGTWQTILALDASYGHSNLAYLRGGRILSPNTAAATHGIRWLSSEHHRGDTFDLGAGAVNRYVKIAHNTSGAWVGTAGTTLLPRVTLEEDDLAGTEPAAGTGAIWHRNVFGFFANFAGTYQYYRLRIPVQSTADGYFQIGALVVGPMAMFGRSWDRGWTTRHDPQVTITERPDRVRSSRRDGATRRQFEMAWQYAPIDATEIDETTPVPDYFAGSVGGLPVSVPGDTARLLAGVLERVEHRHPFVLARAVPQIDSQGSAYYEPDSRLWLYGRSTAGVQTVTPIGREGVSEVERVEQITVVEEV